MLFSQYSSYVAPHITKVSSNKWVDPNNHLINLPYTNAMHYFIIKLSEELLYQQQMKH